MKALPRVYDYMMLERIGDRPITAMQVAEHLKIDQSEVTGEFKTYIESVIDAAVMFGERYTKLTFYNSSFVAYLNSFMCGANYELRRGPLNSITSIFNTVSGAQVEVDSDSYYHISGPIFGRIAAEQGHDWPSTDDRMHSIAITFTAGFTSLPYDIRSALLDHIGALYSNRGDCTSGSTYINADKGSLPLSSRNVYSMRKVRDIFIGM